MCSLLFHPSKNGTFNLLGLLVFPFHISIDLTPSHQIDRNLLNMADIEMPDADTAPVSGSSKGKVAAKSAKTGAPETGGEGKKRFEVKKVC